MIQAVREWLEETAPEFQPVEIRRGYWMHTVKQIGDQKRSRGTNGDLVTEADPDAPIRQRKGLKADDAVCLFMISIGWREVVILTSSNG